MNQRSFLSTLGMAGLAASGCKYWPDDGIWNACSGEVLPPHLAQHELVQAAWEGIDPNYFWDVHVHLLGVGDGASGIWANPSQSSLTSPVRYFFQKIYPNASCADVGGETDARFLQRLRECKMDCRWVPAHAFPIDLNGSPRSTPTGPTPPRLSSVLGRWGREQSNGCHRRWV